MFPVSSLLFGLGVASPGIDPYVGKESRESRVVKMQLNSIVTCTSVG